MNHSINRIMTTEETKEIDWDDIEKHCGKHPNGTVFESAWWASRVENYLRIKKMDEDMKKEKSE